MDIIVIMDAGYLPQLINPIINGKADFAKGIGLPSTHTVEA